MSQNTNHLLLLIVLALALLSGLLLPRAWQNKPPTPPAVQALPPLQAPWKVTLIKTGGFIGLHRSIEISSTGKIIASNEQISQTVNLLFTAQIRAQLEALLQEARYQPATTPSGCADCYNYQIKIIGGGQTFTAQLDDVSLPASGLDPLVRYLNNLMEDSLQNTQ